MGILHVYERETDKRVGGSDVGVVNIPSVCALGGDKMAHRSPLALLFAPELDAVCSANHCLKAQPLDLLLTSSA